MADLTHFDDQGASRMVDVGGKQVTARLARASGRVRMAAAALTVIRDRKIAKGDVLEVARLAGIMAAKRTSELIPLAHPVPVEAGDVAFDLDPTGPGVEIEARVRTTARTGVEMEALTAVTAAALTLYDMLKAVDRVMVIGEIALWEKRGGRSGTWKRPRPVPDASPSAPRRAAPRRKR